MAPTQQPTLTREQQQALAKARARARVSAASGGRPANAPFDAERDNAQAITGMLKPGYSANYMQPSAPIDPLAPKKGEEWRKVDRTATANADPVSPFLSPENAAKRMQATAELRKAERENADFRAKRGPMLTGISDTLTGGMERGSKFIVDASTAGMDALDPERKASRFISDSVGPLFGNRPGDDLVRAIPGTAASLVENPAVGVGELAEMAPPNMIARGGNNLRDAGNAFFRGDLEEAQRKYSQGMPDLLMGTLGATPFGSVAVDVGRNVLARPGNALRAQIGRAAEGFDAPRPGANLPPINQTGAPVVAPKLSGDELIDDIDRATAKKWADKAQITELDGMIAKAEQLAADPNTHPQYLAFIQLKASEARRALDEFNAERASRGLPPVGSSSTAPQAPPRPIPTSTQTAAGGPPIQPPPPIAQAANAAPPPGNLQPVTTPPVGQVSRDYAGLHPKVRAAVNRLLENSGVEPQRIPAIIANLDQLPPDKSEMVVTELIRKFGAGDPKLETNIEKVGRDFTVNTPTGKGDNAQAVVRGNIRRMLDEQGPLLEKAASDRFGPGAVATNEAIEAEVNQIRSVYRRILDPNKPYGNITSPAKRKEIDAAREDLKSYLKGPDVAASIPNWVRQDAINTLNRDLRAGGYQPIQKSGMTDFEWAEIVDTYPTQIAHALQSSFATAGREASKSTDMQGKALARDLSEKRGRSRIRANAANPDDRGFGLLYLLEKSVDKYRDTRIKFGHEMGARDALTLPERFLSIADDEVKLGQFLDDLDELTPAQFDAAKSQITTVVRNAMGKKIENPSLAEVGAGDRGVSTPNLTQLSKRGVLEALEKAFGADGKKLADDIRLSRAKTNMLTKIEPDFGPRSASNIQDAANAPRLYEDPTATGANVIDQAGATLGGLGLGLGAMGNIPAAAGVLSLAGARAIWQAIKNGRKLSPEQRTQFAQFLFALRRGEAEVPRLEGPDAPPPSGPPPITGPKGPPKISSPAAKAGMGASPEAVGGATGAGIGYFANPYDANQDGVIDDKDRGLNAMSGLMTGVVGGNIAKRGVNAMRNITPPKGPPTGPAQATFGGGRKPPTEPGSGTPPVALRPTIDGGNTINLGKIEDIEFTGTVYSDPTSGISLHPNYPDKTWMDLGDALSSASKPKQQVPKGFNVVEGGKAPKWSDDYTQISDAAAPEMDRAIFQRFRDIMRTNPDAPKFVLEIKDGITSRETLKNLRGLARNSDRVYVEFPNDSVVIMDRGYYNQNRQGYAHASRIFYDTPGLPPVSNGLAGKGPPKKPAAPMSRAAEEATRELKAARSAYNRASGKWVMKDDREMRVKPLEDRVVQAEQKLATVLQNDAKIKLAGARIKGTVEKTLNSQTRSLLAGVGLGVGVGSAAILGANSIKGPPKIEKPISPTDPEYYWSRIKTSEDAMSSIQIALKSWDLWPEDTEMTGNYGRVTKDALRRWRADKGLNPDEPMSRKDVERLLAGPKGYQDGQKWRYGDGEAAVAP